MTSNERSKIEAAILIETRKAAISNALVFGLRNRLERNA